MINGQSYNELQWLKWTIPNCKKMNINFYLIMCLDNGFETLGHNTLKVYNT
jgi:hypothetical protein